MPKVIRVENFGGVEELKSADVPLPALKTGELRVAIRAIGVNRADVLMRKGVYHGAKTPLTPGLEASGVVIESQSDIPVGARVVIFHSHGNLYAEQAIVRTSQVVIIPETVTYEVAASVPVNWLTAWYSIQQLLKLKAEESILICAAGSGVGQTAIQIAKSLGARVIAGASSQEKLEAARAQGADEVINYSKKDLLSAIQEATEGRGVDTVLEIIGADFFTVGLKALRPFGRLVALANVSLGDSVMNTRDFYPKNASIFGFQLGGLLASGKYDARNDLSIILQRFAEGKFKPLINHIIPLEEAARAHQILESREANLGKIVLTVGMSAGRA